MFSALGVVSYGQCSFDCFLNDYFDVYVETDSLSELVSWNKATHEIEERPLLVYSDVTNKINNAADNKVIKNKETNNYNKDIQIFLLQ